MQNEVFRMLLNAYEQEADITMVVVGNGSTVSKLFPNSNDNFDRPYYNVTKKVKTKGYHVSNNQVTFGDTNDHTVKIMLTKSSTSDFRWMNEVTKLKSFSCKKTTTLGDSCFKNATSLQTCDCPNVTTYSIRVFQTSGLSGDYKVNPNTSYIGSYCFNTTKLVSLDLRCLITSIPTYCANGSTLMETVTLGNNITTIGDYAFANCPKLVNINVPTSLTTLGTECLAMTKIQSFDISNNNITAIGSGCFRNSKLSGSFVIPNSVTVVGLGTFNNTLITSITLPSQITAIGGNGGGALRGFCEGCQELTTVVFNNVLEIIDYCAFNNCKKLQIQQLPSTLTKIGEVAFGSTEALDPNLALPDSIEVIDDSAFHNSSLVITRLPSSLKTLGKNVGTFAGDLVVPNGVKNIAYGTFQGQLGLTSITFGDDFEIIGDADDSLAHGGIMHCLNLTRVEFGTNRSSLQSIGTLCFAGCSALNTIIIHSTQQVPDLLSTHLNTTCVIYVPDDMVTAYQAATNWSNYTIRGIGELS